MNRFFSQVNRMTGMAICQACLVSVSTLAQSPQERKLVEDSGGGSWFWIIIIALLVLGGGVLVWYKQKGNQSQENGGENRNTNYYNSHESYEMDGLDVDKELEWLRKAKKRDSKTAPLVASKSRSKVDLGREPPICSSAPIDLDTKVFQEKMRMLQYAQLPINSFSNLAKAKLFEPLPLSEDPSLLNAIEQANEEYEEDEAVRELALKILAAFRSRNSVDALTQIALYDLSSALRSKAVTTLTDFDHPSVFEPILLACADPTREVRAAAARGLFRLSFDRSDAWIRILETNDEFRMSHAARAAIESGIAVKSFERLIHGDLKVAYEAFSLVAFMIESGETDEIFKAIRNHKDERVKFALLHVLKVQKNESVFGRLDQLRGETSLSHEVVERVKDTIATFEKVAT